MSRNFPWIDMSLTDNSHSLIELSDVHKVYKTSAGDFPALRGINLVFQRGEFTAIIGKSGSGKSTLINMITGIDHPTSGAVRIGERNLGDMREGAMAEWRGRNLGIVFQFFQLLPTLTVLENILLAMDYAKVIAPEERESRALFLLEQVGLAEMAEKLPAALAGGQQQIAAIARALANDPPILIADEPTGNLDSHSANRVLDMFERLAGQGKTVLLVTHDPTLVRRAKRRVVISDGELVHEALAHALPMIPHTQLLQLTKAASIRTYAAGATIVPPMTEEHGLIVFLSGQAQLVRSHAEQPPEPVITLRPHDHITAMELERAELRSLWLVAFSPVEALCVTQSAFRQFLGANPASQDLFQSAAEHNLLAYESREPLPLSDSR
jgi:ABC-type lipoprotein export system ATPase subunit